MADYRVLLIEDDFLEQENVLRTLNCAEETFEVALKSCLQDGVQSLRNEKFDVILLDLSLPDSYGEDTINRMLEEFSMVPIVVLSGMENEDLAKKAKDLGVCDYLIKGETSGVALAQTIVSAVQMHCTDTTLT